MSERDGFEALRVAEDERSWNGGRRGREGVGAGDGLVLDEEGGAIEEEQRATGSRRRYKGVEYMYVYVIRATTMSHDAASRLS